MSAYTELAVKRLNEFMEAHKASVDDMDKVLGVRPGTVQSVLQGKAGTSIYSERIVMDMTDDAPLIRKLNEMLGIKPEKTPEPVKQETVEKKEEKAPASDSGEVKPDAKIKHEAFKQLHALKSRLNLSWPKLEIELGFNKQELSNANYNYNQGKNFSDAKARQILDKIMEYHDSREACLRSQSNKEENEGLQGGGLEDNNSVETTNDRDDISTAAKSETTHESDIQEDELSPEESQAEADIYGAQFRELPEVTCIGCGCTDSNECEEGCTWLAMNTRNQTGVCTCCEHELERWEAMQSDHGRRASGMPSQLAGAIRMTITEAALKEAGRRYLEDELGIDIEELKALEKPIDHLLYARRHGLKAKIDMPYHIVNVS